MRSDVIDVGPSVPLSIPSPFYFSRAAIHPYLLLGLYQARPPSATSRHLSLAAHYFWRLKCAFFSHILRLISQRLSC